MKVAMKINLGSRDAAVFKIDHTKCQEGMTVDVPDAAAEFLIGRGWALPEVVEGTPKPVMKGK